MIYTITTNPSLDYYMQFNEKLKLGYNRSEKEYFGAGGKGVNVSIFLHKLNIPSTATGFLGGFVKEYYLDFLNQYSNIRPLFTNINESSRINVKIKDENDTSLNAKGPKIKDEEFNRFLNNIKQVYDDDFVILSGNIQEELKDKMVDLIHEISRSTRRIILDTDLDVMKRCLDINPYLIKLNEGDVKLEEESIVKEIEYCVENGSMNVLFSSSSFANYYLGSKNNILKYKKYDGLIRSIGSSDSIIAGYVYSKLHGGQDEESFKYAIAASECLSLTNDDRNINDVEKIFNSVELESIK